MDIDWDTLRCPFCEAWEAKQEGSPMAEQPCSACQNSTERV